MTHDAASHAPESIVYCVRCAARMVTRAVAGKPRRACPACGHIHFVEPKVGVGVMVVRDGELLLVRRRMQPEKGKWGIPAGFLDHGDDPRETAVRETREETNLEVAISELVEVFKNPPQAGGASLFILFRARLLGGELRAADDADAAGFFALDALPELAFPSSRAAVRLLLQEQRTQRNPSSSRGRVLLRSDKADS